MALEATRQKALDVALDMFGRKGYEGTSLREIAESLGVSKAALYYHFPSKDALLVTLVLPFLQALEDLLSAADGDTSGGARASLLANYLDLFVDHRSIVNLLARDPAALAHPEIGPRLVECQQVLRN